MVTSVRAFIIHELYIHEYIINTIYRSITSTLMFKGGAWKVFCFTFLFVSLGSKRKSGFITLPSKGGVQ